ncbi:hypothetical protein DQW50_07325 [Halorubrum sp. 48-1-W]|uniref:hypothetical protein n=1 Tax=Halorubrum sp. 48-1-W TaxID=2249761 RepID=UPI000DCEDBEF|nr:hypothetical protein [Halorubrum sp. 48-1-W]RAW45817.1 hypothetical protein DQW50_07325 [Halorubrum sp. 48-1-W]
MAEHPLSRRTAQLDKAEREHLEDVVEDLRERAEANVTYRLRQHDPEDEPGDVDEDEELAWEIADACEDFTKGIRNDRADRALSEITTAGYRPNRSHDVAINVTPFAEAEIVPKTVEDTVL